MQTRQSNDARSSLVIDRIGLSPKARRFVEEAVDHAGGEVRDLADVLSSLDKERKNFEFALSDNDLDEDTQADLSNDLMYLEEIEKFIKGRLGK